MINYKLIATFARNFIMTEEQRKQISNFEARVRQLMFLCDELRETNAQLREELALEKETVMSLQDEIRQMTVKYDNLKTARIISVKADDFTSAKKRLSNLVREVDKCIALLNE